MTEKPKSYIFQSWNDYIEFQKQMVQEQKKRFLPIIDALAKKGDWEEFCDRASCIKEIWPEVFAYYYQDIPLQYRRDFVLACYSHEGDRVPGCRKALRQLPKNGINELPEEYAKKKHITVYRAGEETLKKAKYRLSWTLDKEVAVFFFKTWREKHARAIYQGKIAPCDVIAYCNERDEKEILQYGHVFDVKEVCTL